MKIEVSGRRGRRYELVDLNKTRVLEIERRNTASYSAVTRFGRGCGPVVRQAMG
jgi:hypothetical protein